MSGISHSLMCLLTSRGAVTAVLVALVTYGNTLCIREEDQLYLNAAEQEMMASERQLLIGKMRQGRT